MIARIFACIMKIIHIKEEIYRLKIKMVADADLVFNLKYPILCTKPYIKEVSRSSILENFLLESRRIPTSLFVENVVDGNQNGHLLSVHFKFSPIGFENTRTKGNAMSTHRCT